MTTPLLIFVDPLSCLALIFVVMIYTQQGDYTESTTLSHTTNAIALNYKWIPTYAKYHFWHVSEEYKLPGVVSQIFSQHKTRY